MQSTQQFIPTVKSIIRKVSNMKLSLATLLSASALVSAAPFAEPEPILDERQAAQSIDAAMKAKGRKYFGTCSDPGRFNSGQSGAIIKANFGQITPENS
jgi:endo-1,4-beta-xylanase